LFEGYVPEIDATIVTRLLNAGATITGKLNMESFAFSGSSDTSDFGTVTNPRAPEYIAGGSSSGSGAAVAAGEVDVAIGGDQGGSIRIQSSCCGIVGIKLTTGLVPYTGIFPIDSTLDHTGPMAEALEVMAGTDGLDPRQPAGLDPDPYTDALVDDIEGTTVAVPKEGFDREESDPEVNATVRDAIETLESLGAETVEVSVPRHLDSLALWIAIAGYGGVQTLKQGGTGSLLDGWSTPVSRGPTASSGGVGAATSRTRSRRRGWPSNTSTASTKGVRCTGSVRTSPSRCARRTTRSSTTRA
jgi:amidase